MTSSGLCVAATMSGLGTLNKGGDAEVWSVSCGSAGSCVADGDYEDQHLNGQRFVAAGRHGA